MAAISEVKRLAQAGQKLGFRNLLTELAADGRLAKEDVDHALISPRDQGQKILHPIEQIANFEFSDLAKPARYLDQYSICEWLAEQVGQDYFHIDPLKIAVKEVTAIFSISLISRPPKPVSTRSSSSLMTFTACSEAAKERFR